MRELEQLLVAHIEAHGPIGFDEFQANALYSTPHGFYARGGGAGRRRDFLTSPEVGPLFGAVLARALDSWWDELGQPAALTLVECGAGPGTLARSVLAAEPRCRAVLRVVLVEVGEVQWATHPAVVESRAELPEPSELGEGPVVVLANELLDNLPVALAEQTQQGWAEVVVDVGEGRLVWGRRHLPVQRQAWCRQMAPDAQPGAVIPVQAEAAAWLADALALIDGPGGRVVLVDYARPTSVMAGLDRPQWLRTYAAHGRAGSPLDDPGSCDITCDVALDQLALVAQPTAVRTQAEFLRAHGIDAVVDEGRQTWAALGIAGGLPALAAQSRVPESQALLDPTGLGGFTVAEWVR